MPRNLIEDAPRRFAQSVDFWIAQANLAARRGELDQAQQILDEARRPSSATSASTPPCPGPFLLREHGPSGRGRDREAGRRADAFSPDEKVRLWNGLVDNLLEIKEYDRAKRLCRQIARLQPHDAMIRYRLLELALVTHDARDPAASLAELDRVLEEIDDIAGQGPLWLYGKAVRLKLEAGSDKPELLDEAMDYASAGAENAALAGRGPTSSREKSAASKGQDEEALQHYLAGLGQRRSRSGLHPPPVANALRAAALPGSRAGDRPLGQQTRRAADHRDRQGRDRHPCPLGRFRSRPGIGQRRPTTPPRTTTAITSGTARC